MKTKKIKPAKIIKNTLNIIFGTILAILKTITIDLFKNIHLYIIMATNKEEREKIRREAELTKKTEIIKERLEVVERLLYSMYNDPTYTKRDAGKTDLKDLEKEAKT